MSAILSKHRTFLADTGLFYCAAIWGSTFFVVKGALDDMDPIILVGYRFLLAGLGLLVYLLVTKRPVFAELSKSVFLGVILWLLYVSQTIGLKYTTASNSGFITGLFVAFVPLFLRIIFKRKPTLMEVLASGVSLMGLWILTGGLSDINIGDILTLIAAMTYALHLLYIDKYVKAGIDPYVTMCQQLLIVGLLSLITGFAFNLPFGIGSSSTGWVVLFLALFPTMSALVIQGVAQKYTSPLKVSLIFAMEPVFAALFAWTLGGEDIVFHRALGGLLIFVALAMSGFPVSNLKKT